MISEKKTHLSHQGNKIRKVVVAPAALQLPLDPLQMSSNSAHSHGPSRRTLSRGNSSKGTGLLQTSESRMNHDNHNPLGTARSRNNEQSDVSEQNSGSICCNMKFSDLKAESLKYTYYNSFEAGIIEERKGNREKAPGRTIKSIRSHSGASVFSSFTKFASGSGSLTGMTMITDNILLGGREEAENASLLLGYGVTHVLNTAQQLPNYFPQHFVYLKVALLDSTAVNVVEVCDSVVSFLTHVENVHGRVLVHCLAGVSRSVSVLLMHLMVRHRLPLQDGFRYLRSCRPQICPNDAFKLQLARLEVQELRYSSVARDADRAWDFYDWNSIKQSMPTVRPDDDEGERYLSPSQSQGRAGAGGEANFMRQISASSLQDVQNCCAIS